MDADHHNKNRMIECIVENRTLLYGYILTLVPNIHAAEDIFQETCLTICQKWHTYNQERPFRPWAFGIARNKARQHLTRSTRSKLTLTDPELLDQVAASPAWEEDNMDEKVALHECLKTLTGKVQAMMRMRYFEACDVPTIARKLAWNVRSISVAMTRARIRLMDCIDGKLAHAQDDGVTP